MLEYYVNSIVRIMSYFVPPLFPSFPSYERFKSMERQTLYQRENLNEAARVWKF